jgi:CO/xanthine dehydrogenase Mo-binding subunit
MNSLKEGSEPAARGGQDEYDWEFPEPERYELREGPYYHFEVNRREFVGVLGAGVILSVAIGPALAQQAGGNPSRPGGRRGGGGADVTLAQRLHIGVDGMITVMTSKVEAGQGSRTQLTQAAGEELQVPLERVRFVMGDTAGPDDGGTAGSRTTPSSVPAIRRACAAARQLLVETASTVFSVDAKALTVRAGRVEGLPAGKVFGYADLASEPHASGLKKAVAADITLRPVKEWQVLGQDRRRVEARDIVTGAHAYPSDIVRPGMVYGRVLRPATYGATLEAIDLGPARTMEGVIAVRDGDFVGVTGRNSFVAEKALDIVARTAQWKTVPHPASTELSAVLRAKASARSRPEQRGNASEAFKAAAKVHRATYEVAYIQHVPMEPRAAVAEWDGERLTVWTGTQQPSRVRQDLAQSLRVPLEMVRVIVPDMGGGFGGKHSGETAIEAARLAREAKKPVSVRWTREEEFTWAYFRPAGVIDVSAALDDEGKLVAWEHVNFNSGASAIATPYAIANTSTEFKSCEQPLRSGSYRALASTANAFARESMMDELAASVDANPLEFRLKHLTNDRLRAVLTAAAERFDWKEVWRRQRTPQRTGVGLACGIEKGSFVACCVRVEVDASARTFRVAQVTEAYECGAIQNPINLRAQVEGCILQGLGGALYEAMEFKDGRILNASFRRYRVPRFKDVPPMETVLLNRPDLPSVGAGETPIIALAPAIANALENAVQVRLRSLPLRNETWRAV